MRFEDYARAITEQHVKDQAEMERHRPEQEARFFLGAAGNHVWYFPHNQALRFDGTEVVARRRRGDSMEKAIASAFHLTRETWELSDLTGHTVDGLAGMAAAVAHVEDWVAGRVHELAPSGRWPTLAILDPSLRAEPAPIAMILFCPRCSTQHVDAASPPDWLNPPLRAHLCHACGYVWRPADVATTGVAAIATRGAHDGESRQRAAMMPVPPLVELAQSGALGGNAAVGYAAPSAASDPCPTCCRDRPCWRGADGHCPCCRAAGPRPVVGKAE